MALLQLIVFIMRKSCVDTYAYILDVRCADITKAANLLLKQKLIS